MKKDKEKKVVRQRQFTSTYIFGAICPSQNKSSAIVLPDCNADAFQLHLNDISNQVTEKKHAVLIVDQARWHLATKLEIPSNITLIKLPPYSPELNPMEQVWLLLKQRFLANRVFNGFEQIVDECCEAWNSFLKIPNKIKELGTRRWVLLNV